MKLFAFCFLLVLHQVQGFATAERFAPILDLFNDTKFHTTQVEAAICQVQYDFLLSHNSLSPGASKPVRYSSCPYASWTNSLNIIQNMKGASLSLQKAVAKPDLPSSGIDNNPLYHFDMESQLESSNALLIHARDNLITSINDLQDNSVSVSKVRKQLGEILHTLQDFYSHTNWVEMGNTDINSAVGNGDIGVSVNDGDACVNCESSLSNDQQQELNNLKNSKRYTALFHAFGYKFENIFVCKDNVIASGLTSGWRSDEVEEWGVKPAGKCSHGGAADDTAQLPVKGGINKNSATFIFSPHYYLHQVAADLSVTATIRYLEDLRVAINNDDLFGQVIGIEAGNHMAILIDTTGSMSDSIEAVKAYAQGMVAQEANGKENVTVYFAPFNDPDYGPVKVYSNPKILEDYIGTLTADGGGDTPEKCFITLLDMIRVVPPQTNIYIFTDATSKDPELLQTIISTASSKKVHINFLMSGEDSELDVPSCSIQDYKNIAIATDGSYFLAQNPFDINKTATIMTQSNWQTTSLISHSWSSNSKLTQVVHVDDDAEAIEISVSGDYVSLALSVKDSSGQELATNENLVLSTDKTVLYRIPVGKRLTPWTTVFKFNSEMKGQIAIKAQSALEASQTLYDQSTMLPISGTRPSANTTFQLVVNCPDCSSVDAIEFGPCGSNLTKYTSISKAPSLNWWSISDLRIPASTSFLCTRISGKTTAGFEFQRILSDKIQTSTLQLTADLVHPSINIGDNAKINYQVKNLGTTQDTVQLSVTSADNATFIYDAVHPIKANEVLSGSITVELDSDLPGSIDIEISVQSTNPGSRQGNSLDLSLLVIDPNQDITAPMCSVVSSNISKCGIYSPDSCNSTMYNVVFSFNDTGSGVGSVSYPYGTWNISNTMFTENTSNVSYAAAGKISCCHNATLLVVDKSSLVKRCELDLSTKGSSAAKTVSTLTLLFAFLFKMLQN